MKKPTVTNQRKLGNKRSSLLRKSEAGLLKKAGTLQRKLNAYIIGTFLPSLDTKGGRVKNTANNLNKASSLSGLKRFLRDAIDTVLFGYYESEFGKVTKSTGRYFNPFEPTEASKGRILNKGTISTNAFLQSLFENNDIFKSLQNTLINSVSSQQRVHELRAVLTDQIKGKEGKFGLIENYHYRNGYDEFQRYSRKLDEDFSEALNLNYAIYAGGTVKDTREFCIHRNGQVFTREEILEWNTTPANWQGRKPDNNILIDVGGYNCRHDFDWISFPLAKRLRDDIEKSTFDKK